MRSLLPLLTPFLLLALLLAAVRGGTDERADLVLANSADAFTLDPQRMSWLQDLRLGHALYEGLVRWDMEDFTVRPAVASSVPEPSADGRTWTFAFDADARWSNGDPVVPEDFRFAWMRALLPDTGADYAAFLLHLEGAHDFVRTRAEDLAGFALRPSRAAADDDDTPLDPAAVRGLVRRLRGHLDEAADGAPGAADLPLPPSADRPAVRAALDALDDRALDQTTTTDAPPVVAADLARPPALAAWRRALDDARVRRLEAERLHARAEARFARTVAVHCDTRADGVRTLELRVERPVPFLLDLLCFPATYPVHRPTVEGWPAPRPDGGGPAPPPVAERALVDFDATSGRLLPRTEWQRPGRHVGNGPYALERRRFRRDLRLVRNAFFRDPDLAHADVIDLRVIEHGPTAVLALEAGVVDWIADVDAPFKAELVAQARRYLERHADELASLQAAGLPRDEALARLPAPEAGERRDVHVRPAFAIEFMSFNCRPALPGGELNPFADAGVRRAFTHATDRRTIVERVTRLGERPLAHLVPPGSIPGYASPEGLGFDEAAARRELAAAGWVDRDGDGRPEDANGTPFPVVDLLYPTNAPRSAWIASALAGRWTRTLGVAVEPRGIESRFVKDALRAGDFMIGRGRWYGDYGDPTTFLDLSRTGDGNNDRGFSSARVDALLDAAARETDPVERFRTLAEAERVLVQDELPILVLCQLNAVVMYDPARVRGTTEHPRLVHDYARMRRVRGAAGGNEDAPPAVAGATAR